MTRGAAAALIGISLLVSLVFLAGAIGWTGPLSREGRAGTSEATMRFHGKSAAHAAPDPLCQSGECHPVFPHRQGGAAASFLNFHGEFSDCLVCHGKAAEENRTGKKDSGGRMTLKWGIPPPSGNPHGLLSPATPCRGCHSESGMKSLRDRGFKEFPQGFESPTALRMIEERKNQWLPAALR